MLRLLIALALPTILSACSCSMGSPPCDAASKASAVFLGTVQDLTYDRRQPDANGSIQANGFYGIHASFQVAEAFRGMVGRGKQVEIRTGMGGGDCGYPFQLGESYVVYAYESKEGFLTASICSRTAPKDQAAVDLTYLRSPRNGTGLIFGVAGDSQTNGHYDPVLGTYLLAGVSGVTVSLTGQGKSESLTTGEDGSFRFDHLSPGNYSVSVSKKNYTLQYGSKDLELHAGGCAFATEAISLDRRIVGSVTASDGMPANGVQVQLVPVKPDQQNQFFPAATAKTDSKGHYELKDLRAGTYYIGVNLLSRPSKEMPYERYFYPGTQLIPNASFVILGDDAETKICDFPMPARQQERNVEGYVFWPDGRLAQNVNILLEYVRLPWLTPPVAAVTDAKGHFAITAFDGTRYRIHAVSNAKLAKDFVSAEPLVLNPDTDLHQPLHLILTRKGLSANELSNARFSGWVF